MDKEQEYVKMNRNEMKLLRTEIWLAPVLIILPLVIVFLLLGTWFCNGFLMGSTAYDGELFLGLIILLGNLLFDIPFLRSLMNYKREKKSII